MKVYVARLNAEQESPFELVGIFAANSLDHLFWLIDECTDPGACEVAELGAGGIYWDEPVDHKVPQPFTEETESTYPGLPSGASVSEAWGDVFFADGELEWHQPEWLD